MIAVAATAEIVKSQIHGWACKSVIDENKCNIAGHSAVLVGLSLPLASGWLIPGNVAGMARIDGDIER